MTMFNPPHPGEAIREDCLKPHDLSVMGAATGPGISHAALSEVLDGDRGITADMAIRLEMAGWGPAESWLRNQLAYDLWQTRQRSGTFGVTKFAMPEPA